MSTEKIVHEEKAQLDFSASMSYSDYLSLDAILNAQHPRSPAHDEMLFIVQHQTSELWMKLMLHELRAAIRCVAEDELASAFKMLARVSRIMEQLVHAWDVLATMTPPEYSAMRPYLAAPAASRAGSTDASSSHSATRTPPCSSLMHTGPSCWPKSKRPGTPPRFTTRRCACWRAGLRHSGRPRRARLDRPYECSDGVEQVWLTIYRDPKQHWELYQLGEELTDLEDAFRLWRFRHVTTVERVIGFKRGTGGTGGVSYLRKMLDVVLFPEIWKLRTDL